MSAALSQGGPEIMVTMTYGEWQVAFAGMCRGLTIAEGQIVVGKLQQQINAWQQRQRGNGAMMPPAEVQDEP